MPKKSYPKNETGRKASQAKRSASAMSTTSGASAPKFKAVPGTHEEAQEQFAHWAEKAKEHLAAEKSAAVKKNFALHKMTERSGNDLDTEIDKAFHQLLAQKAKAKVNKTEADAPAPTSPKEEEKKEDAVRKKGRSLYDRDLEIRGKGKFKGGNKGNGGNGIAGFGQGQELMQGKKGRSLDLLDLGLRRFGSRTGKAKTRPGPAAFGHMG
ncbi:unnamed protein product [Clonostachys rosea]|uniref:Srp40 C-terminal domain-containing protein n=1 Tax=Bionectria ochroleuca TaxID=29856 RepID=A0ABY6U3C5_BIOOC|nr:unnamed protein product [Clonostachys rosea]